MKKRGNNSSVHPKSKQEEKKKIQQEIETNDAMEGVQLFQWHFHFRCCKRFQRETT